MFSSRLQWPGAPNRLTRLLTERKARGVPFIDLTESNPTRVGLPYPVETITTALADPGIVSYDPDPRGLPQARSAVAADSASRGRPLSADRILLTAGTSEAYALLFKLLADPGDVVLVPRPSYPLFDYLAALEGVRVQTYPLACEDCFTLDVEAIERALDAVTPARARAVVLVNPNNPTGTALRRGARARLDACCAGRGVALISDEVFLDYTGGGIRRGDGSAGDPIVSALPDGSGAPPGALTFVLGGLSKGCGLPQMKLGWIAAGGPGGMVDASLERLELVADTYLTVGGPVMRALPALLAAGESIRLGIADRLETNRRALRRRVGETGSCRVLPDDGGWYSVLQVPAIVEEEELTLTLLSEDGVLVHPGYFFDFPKEAYLILGLLPAPETFDEGIRRILDRVDRR